MLWVAIAGIIVLAGLALLGWKTREDEQARIDMRSWSDE